MKRPRLAVVVGSLLLSMTAFAADPATRATTQPEAAAPGPARVLLACFGEISDGPAHAWIGRAIQQSMLSDLARLRFVRPIVIEQPADQPVPVLEPAAAVKGASDADADYVITGSYQLVGNDLRITGEIIDVDTSESVGGLKASGTLTELFALEDQLGAQMRTPLRQEIVGAPEVIRGGQMPAEIGASGPVCGGYEGSELAQAVDNGNDNYRRSYYYNDYPSYYYPRSYYSAPYSYYPSYYVPYIYVSPFNNFNHNFHHRHDDGDHDGDHHFDHGDRFFRTPEKISNPNFIRPPSGGGGNFIRSNPMNVQGAQRNFVQPAK